MEILQNVSNLNYTFDVDAGTNFAFHCPVEGIPDPKVCYYLLRKMNGKSRIFHTFQQWFHHDRLNGSTLMHSFQQMQHFPLVWLMHRIMANLFARQKMNMDRSTFQFI